MNFSTNDVLCGEICEILECKSLMMVMEFRAALEINDFFGPAMTFVNFEADSPAGVPAELRTELPQLRSGEYATWKIGQGFCAMEPITWNTWARAFDNEPMFNS